MDLGINLAPPSYYWGMAVTIDRALIGSKITVQAKSTGAIGADGWPVGAGNYLQGTILDAAPQEYTLIVLTGAISKIDVNQGADNGGHVKVVPDSHGIATFTAKGGVSLGITTTDPGKTSWAIVPADELDLWKADPTAFNPSYLPRYTGFRFARFMDWMRTNTNLTPAYAEPDMTGGSPLLGAVPLSMIVKFALATRIEPWINIPVNATDDTVRYILKAMEPVRAAGIVVHVEFGNEVWNSAFKARGVAIAQETAQMTAKALPVVKSPTGAQWYGYRAAQVSRVIQAAGWKVRRDFHMVLGCFTALPDQPALVWAGVTAADGTDADFSEWAISSYINGGVSTDVPTTIAMVKADDLDGAFNAILHGPKSTPEWAAKNILPKHKAIADAHGLGLVVYEGGVSTYAIPNFSDASAAMKAAGITKAQVLDFFARIMSDPRAADITTANFAACAAAGVKTFGVYNDQAKWGENGLWGLIGSPGWDAVQKWIAVNRLDPYPALLARVVDMQRQLAALAGDIAAAGVG